MMYKIIGADQKEYGPVTADEVRQWISEGRLNAQSRACLEGAQEWKPLGMFPEFGFISPAGASVSAASAGAPVPIEQVLAGNYSLDIGACISRGWNLFKNNFGTLVVAALLLGVVMMVAGVAVQIILMIVGVNRMPFAQRQYIVTPVYLVSQALAIYPVIGGYYSICLAAIRGQKVGIEQLFSGFTTAFSDLFLAKLVTGLAIAVCMLPYSLLNSTKMAPFMEQFEHLQQTSSSANPSEMLLQMFSQMSSVFVATLPVFVLCMIPATYLSVNWIFTLPLIIDKQMGFWTAMKTSWKIVHKHWFHIFGLTILIGLINLAGFCACCVGLLASFPLSVAALMFAYEDIFGRKSA